MAKDVVLEEGETIINQWTLNFLPEGARYTGKFIVSNKNVFFRADHQISFDRHDAVQQVNGLLKIPRNEIEKIEVFKKWLIFQRLKISLKNNSTYVFDRGIMSMATIAQLLS